MIGYQKKLKMSQDLMKLSEHMIEVSVELLHYSKENAKQLAGAACMVEEWSTAVLPVERIPTDKKGKKK